MAIIGLLTTGIAIAFAGKANTAGPVSSIDEVLQAHNVLQTPDALVSYVAEARKLMYYHVNPGSDLPGYFERKITVSTDGNTFKRDKVAPHQLREQIDIVGEQVACRSEFEEGNLVNASNQLDESESRAVKFSVESFGLIPILKQIQDARLRAVYLGPVEGNQDKFEIKTASGIWVVLVDSWHVIQRVQMIRNQHTLVIDFADYREVDGIQLPFLQHVSLDGALLYDLFFTKIDLNPSFPPDSFGCGSIVK